MAETLFNVIGGEYADTSFTALVEGVVAERYGPMPRVEAMALWRSLSAKSVDNCMVRYYVRAVEEHPAEEWFVAGGEYSATDFSHLAKGRELEVFGPYTDRAQALAVWRAITAKTVDDALCRYDIVTGDRLRQLRVQTLP